MADNWSHVVRPNKSFSGFSVLVAFFVTKTTQYEWSLGLVVLILTIMKIRWCMIVYMSLG